MLIILKWKIEVNKKHKYYYCNLVYVFSPFSMHVVHFIFGKIVDLFSFFYLICNEKLDSYQKDGIDTLSIFLLFFNTTKNPHQHYM